MKIKTHTIVDNNYHTSLNIFQQSFQTCNIRFWHVKWYVEFIMIINYNVA